MSEFSYDPGVMKPAPIYAVKFEKRFRYDEEGNPTKEDHWCTWAKRGVSIPTETSDRVDRLKQNPPVWMSIESAYNAWLEGTTFVTDGMPLEAWPGLDKHQVEALRKHKIYSVEDLAAMGDSDLQRVGFPGVRPRRDAARKYLETKREEDQISKLEAKIKELEAKAAGKPVAPNPTVEPVENIESLNKLRLRAEDLGIKVDGRWSELRLKNEIKHAESEQA